MGRVVRATAGGYDKFYYHADDQNSAVAVTDARGTLTGTQLFDSWGNSLPNAKLGKIERYGYTGREPDATGLIYYRARYYDPTTARFTQRDPIGLRGGINQYAYVDNDPVNFLDPSGEVALGDNALGAGIAGIVDVVAQYTQAKLAGKSFSWNLKQTAVATVVGFATSGVSALWGSGVEAAGAGAVTSFTVRTGGNAVIGATANVGQTATMNYMDNKNDSLTKAALWGGVFAGLGSVMADTIPAISAATNQTKINALSPGDQNLLYGIASLNGLRLGGPSPRATTAGLQLGNIIAAGSAFNPGETAPPSSSTSSSTKLGKFGTTSTDVPYLGGVEASSTPKKSK